MLRCRGAGTAHLTDCLLSVVLPTRFQADGHRLLAPVQGFACRPVSDAGCANQTQLSLKLSERDRKEVVR